MSAISPYVLHADLHLRFIFSTVHAHKQIFKQRRRQGVSKLESERGRDGRVKIKTDVREEN